MVMRMIYKLEQIADFNSNSIKKSDKLQTIKYLDTSSITDNVITNFQFLDSSKDKIPSRCKRKIKDKTIIYSTVRPKLHHYGIIDNPPNNLIVSTGFVTIDAHEDVIDPYYLYYYLISNKNTLYLSRVADTAVSSYPSIVPDDIKKLEIDLSIDLDKQKQIGKKIHDIDLLIKNNNDINESLLKKCEEEWNNIFASKKSNCSINLCDCTIGEFIETQPGYAFKSKNWTQFGHPVLTIKNIENGKINYKNCSFIKEYNDKYSKYIAKNGNMIFAMSGNTIGKTGIINSDYTNILINQRVLIIKTTYDNLPFVYFLINNSEVQDKIFKLGANSAQPNISEEELKTINFKIANKSDIDKFNKDNKNVFELITNNIGLNNILEKYKEDLILKYFC